MLRQHITRDHLEKLRRNLISYLKNPLQEVRHVPDWTWAELIFTQVIITAITGAVTGLVGKNFLGIFSGLILTPILTMVTILVSSLFFYYLFQLLSGHTLPFRRMVTLVFLANLPFFILQMISNLVPPISLVGFAFTAVLLVVGFSENFQLQRRMVIKVIIGLYLAIFLVWVWGRWDSLQIERSWKTETDAPEVQLGE